MDIGIFVTDFPYKEPFYKRGSPVGRWGGVGEVCYNLILELAKMGHNIKVFTMSCTNRYEKYITKNIEVYRFKKYFKLENSVFSLDLFKDSLKYNVEVLHLQGTPTNIGPLAGYMYSIKSGLPFVLSYHRDPVINTGSFLRRLIVDILSKYSYKILNDARFITVLSREYLRQSKYLKNYKNKIKIIPNGINIDNYSINFSKIDARKVLHLPSSSWIILYVGSLVEHKNPHILINSISYISKFIPDIKLILVGKGTMLKKLKEISERLNIDSNVIFTGFVDESVKKLYYKAADIFVLPSSAEAFPMVLLEASVFGLPLVVSNLECLRTIVKNGYNGLSVKINDAEDLAVKILYLIENDNVRKKLGKNARKYVEKFSWDKIAREFERIYNKLLE